MLAIQRDSCTFPENVRLVCVAASEVVRFKCVRLWLYALLMHRYRRKGYERDATKNYSGITMDRLDALSDCLWKRK